MTTIPRGVIGKWDGFLAQAGMAAGVVVWSLLAQSHVIRADEPSLTKLGEEAAGTSVMLRVSDSDGKPVAGAFVCQWVAWEAAGTEYYGANDVNSVDQTGEEGTVSLDPAKLNWDAEGKEILTCIHPDRQTIGLVELNRDELPLEISVILKPSYVVEGEMRCSELEVLGREVGWTMCYVSWKGERFMSSGEGTNTFRFLLPAGEYELYPYGWQLYPEHVPVTVGPTDRPQRIDVDLAPVRWALLVGKPAPELKEIKGWLNSEPLQIADFRGKVLLLEFWGHWCGPCVYSMPKLMELYDEFRDQGLVVIGVHDDSIESVAALKEELASIQEEIWEGREIPFPVALAGGGVTPIPGAGDTARDTARGAVCAEYGIYRWPTAILIDRDGIVQGDFQYRADDAREKLSALLVAPSE